MKFSMKAHRSNPGGAYDPVSLHEFDMEPSEFIPSVGDFLQDGEGQPIYKIESRHFDFGTKLCRLVVVEEGTAEALLR